MAWGLKKVFGGKKKASDEVPEVPEDPDTKKKKGKRGKKGKKRKDTRSKKRSSKEKSTSNDEGGPKVNKMKSDLTDQIDSELSSVTADRTSVLDRLMYVLCCVYCSPPKVKSEETPEERERREKIERLMALRDMEIKRLEMIRLAENTLTVVYCANAKTLAEMLKIEGVKAAKRSIENPLLRGEEKGRGGEEGHVEKSKEPKSDDEEEEDEKVVVGGSGLDEDEDDEDEEGDGDDDESDDDEGEDSDCDDPPKETTEEMFQRYAQAHSYDTVFGTQSTDINIRISPYHTPQTGAPEFVRCVFDYAQGLMKTRDDMMSSVLLVQCSARVRIARKAYAKRLKDKEEELQEEARRISREKVEWNKAFGRFIKICNVEARKVAHIAINSWRKPEAAKTIQRFYWGYWVRRRFPSFRMRVLAQRRRRLERQRYLNALELAYSGRADERRRKDDTKRRIYGRTTKGGFGEDRGGWKPNYEAEGDLDMWTHIWKPPEGNQFGVRNLKVKLPPETLLEARVANSDHNSWLGVPVMMETVKKKERLGPPERFDTLKNFSHVETTIPKPPAGKTEVGNKGADDKIYRLKYNWIATNIVGTKAVPLLVEKQTAFEQNNGETRNHP